MRVGLMGGTLDPVHLGHLIIAEEARRCLQLEEVIFIPTGQPWMKEGSPVAPPNHRLNMLRLATASNPFFHVSSIELDRPGPSFTVDTLEQLKAGGLAQDELYVIVGTDLLKEFHLWRRPGRILELCTLVVAPRPGFPDHDLSNLASIGPEASRKVIFLDGPLIGISSTGIRRRVAEGRSVRYQVPEEVEGYMERYGLYRNAG
jgi:nicotinate-nucleotide adenylyltransferase